MRADVSSQTLSVQVEYSVDFQSKNIIDLNKK